MSRTNAAREKLVPKSVPCPELPQEVERKWSATIVDESKFGWLIDGFTLLTQFYVKLDSAHEYRVRKEAPLSDDKPAKYLWTEKSDGGLVRGELEISITEALYNVLGQMSSGIRIFKARSKIVIDAKTVLEIDQYRTPVAPKMRVVLEVEFPDKETADNFEVSKLEELGIFTDIEEQTENPEFKNKNIAASGNLPL